MSHTPGPWTYRKNPMREDGWFAYESKGACITFAQVSEDDARLITAAPEMYSALKEIVDTSIDVAGMSHSEMMAQASQFIIKMRRLAKSAVDKAEGETRCETK